MKGSSSVRGQLSRLVFIIRSGLFSSNKPILSLCCLLICLILCALRLHFCGQKGHWNCGSLPHSYVKCLCKESFLIYIRPHCVQPKFPRILLLEGVGLRFLLKSNQGGNTSSSKLSDSFNSILMGSSEKNSSQHFTLTNQTTPAPN